ncbi:hypothetical protein QL285_075933 [Trifolium repens]|nr:hypothetical protein QL285_075933 [Trifolium repens]
MKRMKKESGQSSKTNENSCHRCGGKGHWARTCRTPKHLINFYSLKEKKIETHLAYEVDDFDYDMDPTHLDVADFLVDQEGKSDHIINGDGNIKN